jgi:hypothetical protein
MRKKVKPKKYNKKDWDNNSPDIEYFNELIRIKPIINDIQFLKLFYKYIDIELFKDKPVFLDDILVYNHLKYEDLKKKSIILKKYENEIVIPHLISDKKILKNLTKWGTYYLMTK